MAGCASISYFHFLIYDVTRVGRRRKRSTRKNRGFRRTVKSDSPEEDVKGNDTKKYINVDTTRNDDRKKGATKRRKSAYPPTRK